MGGIRWIDACHFGDCRMLMTRMAAGRNTRADGGAESLILRTAIVFT
ncbi:hypothetical protein QFZ94_004596 [Paraburkholderia sp. JPY465]